MRCTQCDGRCTIARTLGIDGHTVQSECPSCMGMGTLPDEINPDESVKTESYLERSFLDEPQPLAPKGRPTFAGPDAENPNKRPPHLVPRDGTTILEVVARMPVMSEKGRDHNACVQVVVPGVCRIGQSSPLDFDTVISSVSCAAKDAGAMMEVLSDTIYHMAKENNLLRDANVPEQQIGQGFSYPLGAGFDLGASVFPDDPESSFPRTFGGFGPLSAFSPRVIDDLADMLGVTDPLIKQALTEAMTAIREERYSEAFIAFDKVLPLLPEEKRAGAKKQLDAMQAAYSAMDPTDKTCPICHGTGLVKSPEGSQGTCPRCMGAGDLAPIPEKPTAPMSDNPRTPEEGAPPVPPVGT